MIRDEPSLHLRLHEENRKSTRSDPAKEANLDTYIYRKPQQGAMCPVVSHIVLAIMQAALDRVLPRCKSAKVKEVWSKAMTQTMTPSLQLAAERCGISPVNGTTALNSVCRHVHNLELRWIKRGSRDGVVDVSHYQALSDWHTEDVRNEDYGCGKVRLRRVYDVRAWTSHGHRTRQ